MIKIFLKENEIVIKKNIKIILFGYCIGFSEFCNSILSSKKIDRLVVIKYLPKIISGKFLILIKTSKKEFLIADRFGFIPLFYSKNENIISDDVKYLLSKINHLTINYEGISSFLNYGYFLSDQFFVNEIKRIKAAQIIEFNGNSFLFKTYYTPNFLFNKKLTKNGLLKLKELFLEGMVLTKKELSNPKIISDLSGGYDSRFVFLLDSECDSCLTFDPGSDEFNNVLKIKKERDFNLYPINTTDINKTHYLKLFEEYQGYVSLENPQHIKLIEFYRIHNFTACYDGFAGDAILGGSYLSAKKELLSNFGLKIKYDFSDFYIEKNFNTNLLNDNFNTFLIRKDLTKIEIKKYAVFNDLRKSLLLFKFYNRLSNFLVPGANIRNKQITSIFPFFYYPFFEEYTKYDFDELKTKNLYTKLIKISLSKNQLKLSDDFFRINFLWPQKIRLLNLIKNRFFLKWGFRKDKRITDFKSKIMSDNELSTFIFDQVKKLKILKNSDQLDISKDYISIIRLLTLSLFLQNYKHKIKNGDKLIK